MSSINTVNTLQGVPHWDKTNTVGPLSSNVLNRNGSGDSSPGWIPPLKVNFPVETSAEKGARFLEELNDIASYVSDSRNSIDAKKQATFEFMNKLKSKQTVVNFNYNMRNDQMVARVIERGSGEIKVSIPPEETLRIRSLAERIPGIFMNVQA